MKYAAERKGYLMIGVAAVEDASTVEPLVNAVIEQLRADSVPYPGTHKARFDLFLTTAEATITTLDDQIEGSFEFVQSYGNTEEEILRIQDLVVQSIKSMIRTHCPVPSK